MFEITDAKREAAPIFAAFIGGPGSGKTYSALLFARGIVGPQGRIGVIDTEGKRSLMYADDEDIGGFMHMDFVAPYSSDRFREAINAFMAKGVDAIIIDSASHEHEAEGGMLDYADQEERRMSNNPRKAQARWIKPKMAHNRFVRTAVSCAAHMIFCIREKTIVDTSKTPATKITLPVCESNLPFEFMLAIHMRDEGIAEFQKVPKPFQRHIRQGERITVEHGALLMKEAGRGADTSKTARIISNLEEVASSGTETLKAAWEAAWHANDQATRAEMMKHKDRLKRLATDADEAASSTNYDDSDGADIGSFDRREDPPHQTRESFFEDDDTFPGDTR